METKNPLILVAVSLLLVCLTACGRSQEKKAQSTENDKVSLESPLAFSADSCFAYLVAQTDFGARVPGTPAHEACLDWLVSTLRRQGAAVQLQKANLQAFNGVSLPSTNITAQFNPSANERLLLAAHWDSRPVCDEDPDLAMLNEPVLGANDGASGVAVLLELARLMALQAPRIGVDLIFFDSEDYGNSDYDESFCLGSQYWASQATKAGYTARYGIVLDMVGARGAVFKKEQVSARLAGDYVNAVWKRASQLGLGSLFVDAPGGIILDDHYYVNQAGVPCIDIIHYDNGFPSTWHTANDTPENIDPQVLGAVGRLMASLVYRPL